MPWHPSLSRLVEVLAGLYYTEGQARLPVQGAGLDPTRISFDGGAQVMWHNIVNEAFKHDKVLALIERARRDYGDNADLKTAQADYEAWRKEVAAQPQPAVTPGRAPKLTSQQKWQLVDAFLACPSVNDAMRRNAIVNNLRASIRQNAQRDASPRLDVHNIVSTALSYPGGLRELVEEVRNVDAEAPEMADLDALVTSLGF